MRPVCRIPYTLYPARFTLIHYSPQRKCLTLPFSHAKLVLQAGTPPPASSPLQSEHVMSEQKQRVRAFKRVYKFDEGLAEITFSGETFQVDGSKFPAHVQRHAYLAGLVSRIMVGAEDLNDVKATVAQLEAGTWADKSKEQGPVSKCIAAYLQLAKEAFASGKIRKLPTAKGVTESVKASEKASPGFAAGKMATEQFQQAFARSQEETGELGSLSDLEG